MYRTCLPTELFCDGHPDCEDRSDEGWCDPAHDPNAAPPCDYSNCTLPNCFCSSDGTLIPGGVLPADVPQMIVITFDDAVNDENWDIYQDKLFPPNLQESQWLPHVLCFYVSHQYTNCAMVQKLWNQDIPKLKRLYIAGEGECGGSRIRELQQEGESVCSTIRDSSYGGEW